MSDLLLDCMLMSGNIYHTSDTRSEKNAIPVPNEWSIAGDYKHDAASGFEAAAYRQGNTVAIAFAGTFPGTVPGEPWQADLLTDTLVGGDGADTLRGGDEDDTLYGDAKKEADGDSLAAGADKLFGGDGKDKIYGGSGRDILRGEAGDDTLAGNAGTDYLLGGTGSDAYKFSGRTGGFDYIRDEREGDTSLGSVEFDKTTLSGGKRQGGSYLWKSDDGFLYKTNGDPNDKPVTLTIIGGKGGKLTVLDFKNHDLGIHLKDDDKPASGGGKPKLPTPPRPAGGNGGSAQRRDPLLIDLTGQGITTLGLDAGLRFDHDGDGLKEATGWAGAGTGLLMIDRDGNGQLSDGSELFGDFTPSNGGSPVNGFQALAQYDRNQDGRIDAGDAVWSQLKVWRQAQDPVTGEALVDDPDYAGELVGLDELGIVAIHLDAAGTAATDAQGNTLLRSATRIILPMLAVTLLAACDWFDRELEWRQEVRLHDGRIVTVERTSNVTGKRFPEGGNYDAAQLLTFTHPDTGERITWSPPEHTGPVMLNIDGPSTYYVVEAITVADYNLIGCPNPPYLVYRQSDKHWTQVPIADMPSHFVSRNLQRRAMDNPNAIADGLVALWEYDAEMNKPWRRKEDRLISRKKINANVHGCFPSVLMKNGRSNEIAEPHSR